MMLELYNVTMKPSNVRKELSHVMLELHNVRMESSNVRKKKVKESHNVRKELSHVMLELHNMRMKSSNMRKKSKGITKYEKKTITCDVGSRSEERRVGKECW